VIDSATEALRATVAACETVQANYAVIGGVARNAWAPPRATTDLDLAVFVTIDRQRAGLDLKPRK